MQIYKSSPFIFEYDESKHKFNSDMPQHIVVNITKSYLPWMSLDAFNFIIFMLMFVWGKTNTELATPLSHLVHKFSLCSTPTMIMLMLKI